MPDSTYSVDALATKARRIADRIKELPDVMREFLDATPRPDLSDVRGTLDATEIEFDCSDIHNFIERNWTPSHAEMFIRRVCHVTEGVRAFVRAFEEWSKPQSQAEFDRHAFAPFVVVALLTAQYIRQWADDIAHRTQAATPGASLAKPAIRMSRSEADAKAKAYLEKHPYPGDLRALAEIIGCSHETLRKCPSVEPYVRRRTPGSTPKAVGLDDVPPVADAGEDPLERLVNEETLQEIRGQVTEEERAQIDAMSAQGRRDLIEAYKSQQQDRSEDSRPKYTTRRRKV